MKTYILTRRGQRDLVMFHHREDDDVEIFFRLNENDVHGEPFKVNDWFGDVKGKCYRSDRPTPQADGIWMNGEARWIWDALVKHYGFSRSSISVVRS
jgi:hypothetical protein